MTVPVSIIMSVYETPIEYVSEAIRSVETQTKSHCCELIVWNDGSSENYTKDLETLLSTVKHVPLKYGKTIHNLGICQARNSAVNLASGEWLLILDADDVLDPRITEVVLAETKEGIDVIYTDHILLSDDLKTVIQKREKSMYQAMHKIHKGTLFDPLFHATYIFHCQVFRASTFRKIGGFRQAFNPGEEVDLHLRVSEVSNNVNIAHIPQILYIYRDNHLSVVHNPVYYSRLINNIGQALVAGARRLGYPIISAERIGRACNTNAAHYVLRYSGGQAIKLPYFDYERLLMVTP